MNIRFANITGTGPITLLMTYKGEEVNLIMSPLIARENKKRNIGGLESTRQFEPLLVYLYKYKLESKVFDIYKSLPVRMTASMAIDNSDIMSVVTEELLALINYEKLKKFIVDDLGRDSLMSLSKEYENSIATSGFGSKEQTYLQHEYIELCALIVIFKLVLPPIIHYQYLTATGSKDKKSYDGINLIRDTSMMSLPPVIKLKEFISSLKSTDENNIQTTLTNCIAVDEVQQMVFSVVVISKLLTASFLEDTDDRHVIKVLHGKASKMLNPGLGGAYIHIGKETKVDNSDENALSILENIRVSTKLTIGYIEEFNFYFTDMGMIKSIHSQLKIPYDEELWFDIYNHLEIIEAVGPSDISLEIMSWVIYNHGYLFNPEGISELSKSGIRGLVTICAIFFIQKNMLNAAMLVTAIKHLGYANNNQSKTTTPPEALETLKGLCYGENLVKQAINNLSKDNMIYMYQQLLPDRFIIGRDRITALNKTIRIELAELLVYLNGL